jgi:hypothetical protein
LLYQRILKWGLLGLGLVLVGCAQGPEHTRLQHAFATAPARADTRTARPGNLAGHLRPEAPLPIPVIPYASIHNFLESPRLVAEDTLENAPYVVSLEDRHLVAGKGATVHVRGATQDGPSQYLLVHPGTLYRDYETHEILGRKALPVGRVTLRHLKGHIATASLDTAYREARPGDRLLPAAPKDRGRAFQPHAAAPSLTAHIISVYGRISHAGQYDVVTLDRGQGAGVTRGAVFAIYHPGETVPDPVAGGEVKLPDVLSGQLLIFKVADRVSFGLVMHATRAICVGDVVHAPETT